MFRWLFRPIDVLVLGSAHIDTTGEIDGRVFATGTDQDGRIVYSVGGSGYNIAVNLAAAGNNRRVALNTLLPRESPLADLVTAKLVQNGVALDYVRRLSIRREQAQGFVETAMGGYVGIRASDDVVSSVSRTLVNTPDFWPRGRDRIALGRARAMVVDTYVLETAARDVAERAVKRRIPLFVCAATDSTARRFGKDIVKGTFFAEGAVLCVGGTAETIGAMVWELDPHSDRHASRLAVLQGRSNSFYPEMATDICGSVRARYVACIHDLWAIVLAWNGDYHEIDMRGLRNSAKNQKGDSDALMAAVVDVFLSFSKAAGSVSAQEVLDLRNRQVVNRLTAEAHHHVQRAISSYGATFGSVISFEEPFQTWGRLIERQVKYSVMQAMNAAGWVAIILGTDWLAKLLFGSHIVVPSLRQLGAYLGIIGKFMKLVLGSLFGH